MKKIIIIVISLVLLIILVLESLLISSKDALYINWNIKLPGIQKSTIIFDDFFQDGDQICIFKYYNEKSIKKVIEINDFESISSENVDIIEDNLLDFYNKLSTNIEEINGKEIYNKNINVEQLMNSNNYYLIKRKNQNKSYIILILDVESKKIYTFISIRN